MDWHAEIGHWGEQPRLFRPTAFNFPDRSSVRCQPSVFVSTELEWFKRAPTCTTVNVGGSRDTSEKNSLSQCCAYVVQLIKCYAMMGGDGGGRVCRLGPFFVGVTHQCFMSWAAEYFPPARTLCVCFVSPSRPLCRIIHFMSSLHCQVWKKISQVVFPSDSHTIPVLLHPFIKMNDYTLCTAVMGL